MDGPHTTSFVCGGGKGEGGGHFVLVSTGSVYTATVKSPTEALLIPIITLLRSTLIIEMYP